MNEDPLDILTAKLRELETRRAPKSSYQHSPEVLEHPNDQYLLAYTHSVDKGESLTLENNYVDAANIFSRAVKLYNTQPQNDTWIAQHFVKANKLRVYYYLSICYFVIGRSKRDPSFYEMIFNNCNYIIQNYVDFTYVGTGPYQFMMDECFIFLNKCFDERFAGGRREFNSWYFKDNVPAYNSLIEKEWKRLLGFTTETAAQQNYTMMFEYGFNKSKEMFDASQFELACIGFSKAYEGRPFPLVGRYRLMSIELHYMWTIGIIYQAETRKSRSLLDAAMKCARNVLDAGNGKKLTNLNADEKGAVGKVKQLELRISNLFDAWTDAEEQAKAPSKKQRAKILASGGSAAGGASLSSPAVTSTLTRRERGRMESLRTLTRQTTSTSITPVPKTANAKDIAVLLCELLVPSEVADNAQNVTDCCPLCTLSWDTLSVQSLVAVLPCRHAVCLACLAHQSKSCAKPFEQDTTVGKLNTAFICGLCRGHLPATTVDEVSSRIVQRHVVPSFHTLVDLLELQPSAVSNGLITSLLQTHNFDVNRVEHTLFSMLGLVTNHIPSTTSDLLQNLISTRDSLHNPENALNTSYITLNEQLSDLSDDVDGVIFDDLKTEVTTSAKELTEFRLNSGQQIHALVVSERQSGGSIGTKKASSTIFALLSGLSENKTKEILNEFVLYSLLRVMRDVVLVFDVCNVASPLPPTVTKSSKKTNKGKTTNTTTNSTSLSACRSIANYVKECGFRYENVVFEGRDCLRVFSW